jgi:hypothetical protein
MSIRQSLIAGTALIFSVSVTYAGPCSEDIVRFRAEIDANQHANAATGSTGPESTAATTHRQPTPQSIGAAESQLGEASPAKLQAVTAALQRANDADSAGDQVACEKDLADARRAFSQ